MGLTDIDSPHLPNLLPQVGSGPTECSHPYTGPMNVHSHRLLVDLSSAAFIAGLRGVRTPSELGALGAQCGMDPCSASPALHRECEGVKT